MKIYLDSSVLLRVIFAEPNVMPGFSEITHAVSSELIKVECLRTTDRLRIKNAFSDKEYLTRVDLVYRFIKSIELIPISKEILNRASQPFPTHLATLDAIHLSTCLLYRDRIGDVPLWTHDEELKRAAQAVGLEVR